MVRTTLSSGSRSDGDEVRDLRDASWRLFLADAPEELEEGDPEPWGPAEAGAVRRAIRGLARDRTEGLLRLRESRPDESAARDARAEMAAFAPRPEDPTLQRYEAQLSREFHQALADLVKLVKTGADLVEEAEAEAPSEADSQKYRSRKKLNAILRSHPGSRRGGFGR